MEVAGCSDVSDVGDRLCLGKRVVQGDRRATQGQMGLGLQGYNLETSYGEAALKEVIEDVKARGGYLYVSPCRGCTGQWKLRVKPRADTFGGGGG